METRKMFRLKLTRIASLLGTEQLERLKYLCQDDIPHGDRERVKTRAGTTIFGTGAEKSYNTKQSSVPDNLSRKYRKKRPS